MGEPIVNIDEVHPELKEPQYFTNDMTKEQKIKNRNETRRKLNLPHDEIPPPSLTSHIVLVSKDDSSPDYKVNIVYINKGDNTYSKYTKNGDNYNDDKKKYIIRLEETFGGGGKKTRNRKKKTRHTKTFRKR